jgi:hypothetical protein
MYSPLRVLRSFASSETNRVTSPRTVTSPQNHGHAVLLREAPAQSRAQARRRPHFRDPRHLPVGVAALCSQCASECPTVLPHAEISSPRVARQLQVAHEIMPLRRGSRIPRPQLCVATACGGLTSMPCIEPKDSRALAGQCHLNVGIAPRAVEDGQLNPISG